MFTTNPVKNGSFLIEKIGRNIMSNSNPHDDLSSRHYPSAANIELWDKLREEAGLNVSPIYPNNIRLDPRAAFERWPLRPQYRGGTVEFLKVLKATSDEPGLK
jgi:hypothetical protein